MVSTFPLIAAGLLLGQAPAPETSAPKTYIYSGGVLVPMTDAQKAAVPWANPPETNKRPILTKIQGWFGKRDSAPPAGAIYSPEPTTRIITTPSVMPPAQTSPPPLSPSSAVSPNDVPKKMPPITNKTSKVAPGTEVMVVPNGETVSTVALKPAATVAAKGSILPGNVERIGRDEKFAWVTGQLEVENGHYVLIYATPETVDPYHGKIALSAGKVDLRAFRSGDLISTRGQLHSGRGAAVYQLTEADLIERPKR
jgi:hypothetical protein